MIQKEIRKGMLYFGKDNTVARVLRVSRKLKTNKERTVTYRLVGGKNELTATLVAFAKWAKRRVE